MMAADLQNFPQTDFYKGLGKLTDGFLAQRPLRFWTPCWS